MAFALPLAIAVWLFFAESMPAYQTMVHVVLIFFAGFTIGALLVADRCLTYLLKRMPTKPDVTEADGSPIDPPT